MKPRHLVAFLAVVAGTLALNATRVWATDLNVTQSDSCAGINVHIVSVWDGVTKVYVDDGTSPIHVDVAPHETRDVPVQWNARTEVRVVVSAPAAHLHGAVDVTHTLPASCTTTTTEAPPSTTSPTTAPTAPSTSAPPVGRIRRRCDDCACASSAPSAPSPSRPPSSTPVSLTLPTTGSDDSVQRALIGLAAAIVGTAVVMTTRRRAACREGRRAYMRAYIVTHPDHAEKNRQRVRDWRARRRAS
jgi:LPXTG-motif cell wall-anchored protein